MDLRNLITFIQVAEMKSFTRAGEHLGYSQPTISFQIKQLEKEMGAQLFERIGHTVTLTDAGRDALNYAHQICRLTQEMGRDEETRSEPQGLIRLAMADSLCIPLVAQSFARLRGDYPHISLQVTTAGTDELFRRLDHNEADMVCTLDVPIYNTNYIIANEEEIGVHFIAAADHPLARQSTLCIAELLPYPFLLTEKNMSYGRLLTEQLARRHIEIHPILEIGSADMVCRLVAEGMGISFLPDYVTEDAVRSGSVVRLQVNDIQARLHKQLLYHRGKWMSRQLQAVIDHLSRIHLSPESL